MNKILGGVIYPLLLPGGLLVGLSLWGLRTPYSAQMIAPFVDILALMIVAGGLFFGWRFNRSRLLYALVLLVLTDRLLCWDFSSPEFVQLVAATVLPLNLAILVWFGERGVLTGCGLRRWAFFGAQVGALGWLYQEHLDLVVDWLTRDFVPLPMAEICPLPQSVQLVFALTFIVLLIRFFRCPTIFEGCFVWATVAVLLAISQALNNEPTTAYFASALLILLLGVVESSYHQAFRDELTGLPGRRAFNDAMLKLGSRYTIAMVDIDHFKKFNDTHGHDVGDQVLRMVAETLSGVRGGGRAFRYGGEEFTIIFRGKETVAALPYLEELREEIAESVFVLRSIDRPKQKPEKPRATKKDHQELNVTVSIGVAQRTRENPLPDDVFKAADVALYRAKDGGRNQVAE